LAQTGIGANHRPFMTATATAPAERYGIALNFGFEPNTAEYIAVRTLWNSETLSRSQHRPMTNVSNGNADH